MRRLSRLGKEAVKDRTNERVLERPVVPARSLCIMPACAARMQWASFLRAFSVAVAWNDDGGDPRIVMYGLT